MLRTWDLIKGHEAIIAELREKLAQGTLPHALLFSGEAGIGKTLVAEALAATLLCSEGTEAPCGLCASCRALAADTHPDLYRLQPEAKGKAAPLIRIGEVREMQNAVSRLPLLSSRRVVIIEEAETMNPAAANSLLKVLEEPVGSVTFILVTNSRSNLLDTIISRTMPLSFGLLPAETIAAELTARGTSPEEADSLAALADGSLGRALALREEDGLDRAAEICALLKNLTDLTMTEVWNVSAALGGKTKPEVINWLKGLILICRDMLAREDDAAAYIYNRGLAKELQEMAPGFSPVRLLGIMRLAVKTQRLLSANVNLRLQAEAFMVRLRDIK